MLLGAARPHFVLLGAARPHLVLLLGLLYEGPDGKPVENIVVGAAEKYAYILTGVLMRALLC